MQSILTELRKEEIAGAIAEARQEAAGNMGEIMAKVVPIFFEVQGHVMEPLGFVADDEGFAQFADELKKHESDDEFLDLSKQLKKIMKDSTTPPVAGESDEDEE